ncbi:MAG: type IV secretion system DNA-binding domain-containing protein [Alphaproteobacteria bacterium]|nr:type IV secretion system DNA-binding domain-containing protein [Alphaproteobacteria bacterium]
MKDITYLGESNARGERIRFGIKEEDRARHMYIIGQTGTGKSTLIENMVIQDIVNGKGCICMDPHGQTVEQILEYIPEYRLKDVIYFAPHDQSFPIGLNIMEDVGYDKRHLVVSSLLSAFAKIWGENSWSDRMENILSNTLLALLEFPNTTLLDVGRMYSSKQFRKEVVDNIKDPQVKQFWTEEFAAYTERYAAEATPAIQNKLGQFTSNPIIRNIVGQVDSAFNFRQVMDDKKILLINLSKGTIGETNAKMLGVLFTTKVYLAALSRADVSTQELAALPPCTFYVDEFQSFASSTFAGILSEARKYKLHLVIAHQYIDQLEEEVRNAVFGNIPTIIAFRLGPLDGEFMERIFSPVFEEKDIITLPRYSMYLTLCIDGAGSRPFSARSLPPPPLPVRSIRNEVLSYSREQYTTPREEVEERINARLTQYAKNVPPPQRPVAQNNFNNPTNERNYGVHNNQRSYMQASSSYESNTPPQMRQVPPMPQHTGVSATVGTVESDANKTIMIRSKVARRATRVGTGRRVEDTTGVNIKKTTRTPPLSDIPRATLLKKTTTVKKKEVAKAETKVLDNGIETVSQKKPIQKNIVKSRVKKVSPSVDISPVSPVQDKILTEVLKKLQSHPEHLKKSTPLFAPPTGREEGWVSLSDVLKKENEL